MKKYITLLFAFLVLFACKKDNDNDNEQPDASGFWIVIENVTGNCDGDDYYDQETIIVEIEQSGTNLNYITYPGEETLEGTIEGNNITVEGQYSHGHSTNIISFSGTIDNSATVFNGTADWEDFSDTHSCSGTAVVSVAAITTVIAVVFMQTFHLY